MGGVKGESEPSGTLTVSAQHKPATVAAAPGCDVRHQKFLVVRHGGLRQRADDGGQKCIAVDHAEIREHVRFGWRAENDTRINQERDRNHDDQKDRHEQQAGNVHV